MCQLAPAPALPETPAAQAEDTCPSCGENELNCGDGQLYDSQYCYTWTCGACGAQGEQVFDLVFSGHTVKKPVQG